MSHESVDEKQSLEEKLDKALDEAWSKLNIAYDQTVKRSGDSSMSVWLAAEALEYTSLLFNLAHGLEDFDPQVKIKRKEDPVVIIQESLDSLKRARELRKSSVTEAYASIRIAADNLKTVYLDRIRESGKKQS